MSVHLETIGKKTALKHLADSCQQVSMKNTHCQTNLIY